MVNVLLHMYFQSYQLWIIFEVSNIIRYIMQLKIFNLVNNIAH